MSSKVVCKTGKDGKRYYYEVDSEGKKTRVSGKGHGGRCSKYTKSKKKLHRKLKCVTTKSGRKTYYPLKRGSSRKSPKYGRQVSPSRYDKRGFRCRPSMTRNEVDEDDEIDEDEEVEDIIIPPSPNEPTRLLMPARSMRLSGQPSPRLLRPPPPRYVEPGALIAPSQFKSKPVKAERPYGMKLSRQPPPYVEPTPGEFFRSLL